MSDQSTTPAHVSFNSFAPDPEPPPTVAQIAEFKPTGDPDDVITVELPIYVRHSLETVARAAGMRARFAQVGAWALDRGSVRLESADYFPDVNVLREARARLLALGSEQIIQLDQWHYRVQAREGSRRHTLRRIGKDARKALMALANDLGLSVSTTGALAMICGLVDAPELPGDRPDLLATEILAFREAARTRALVAQDIVERAGKHPARVRQLSWAAVMSNE